MEHPKRNRYRTATVAFLAATAFVAGSCGGDDATDSKSATRPSTTAVTSSTTASNTTASNTTASDTTASSGAASEAWRQDAQQFRGQNGTTHEQACPAGGEADTVWGAGIYTDDSSVCTAAVQSGLITFDKGGTVTYEIGPGRDSFDGGVANGVTSSPYGTFAGSFTFPAAPPGSVSFAVPAESWSKNLSDQRGHDGTRVTVACSPAGQPGSVWGSGPYTDDSSVCTAAVHAGLITLAKGGTVAAEIAPGESSYSGSTANGVTTSDYGTFGGSFTFPTDQPKN